jgi:hypothetical protein
MGRLESQVGDNRYSKIRVRRGVRPADPLHSSPPGSASFDDNWSLTISSTGATRGPNGIAGKPLVDSI